MEMSRFNIEGGLCKHMWGDWGSNGDGVIENSFGVLRELWIYVVKMDGGRMTSCRGYLEDSCFS